MKLDALVCLFVCVLIGCQTGHQWRFQANCQEEQMNPGKATFQENEDAFFILENQVVCPANPNAVPKTFYVKGHVSQERFVPASQVMGEGNLDSKAGAPGWLELGTGHFYSMQTARAPKSPFVRGHMTKSGFTPSSRLVE